MLAGLAKAGAAVAEVAVPNWDPAQAARAGFLLCEAQAAETFQADLALEGVVSPGARGLMEYGRDCGNAKLLAAFAVVQRTSEAWQRAVAETDFILLPTVPRAAFKIDAPAPDDLAFLTAPANIAGLPAISLPAGLDANGLPVAVQLLGKRGADGWLLSVAGAIEERLSGR
jgi:aspartyl-tRNA(Asn)/glutamyl-tRNA(Gln) amidotransferase subunit A